MSCRRFRRLIYLAASGDATPGEQETLDRHTSRCDRCREEMAAAEGLVKRLQAGRRIGVPRDIQTGLANEVMHSLGRQDRRIVRARQITLSPRRRFAFAAAFVAGVVMLCLIVWRLFKPVQEEPYARQFTRESTFTVEFAKIDGRDANISVLELANVPMTVIWLE